MENLKQRTKKFALDVIRLVQMLPRNQTADVIGRSCCAPELPLPPITGLPVEPDRRPIL